MVNDNIVEYIVPAGRYFLGDPCYTVPAEYWGPLLEASDFLSRPGTIYVDGTPITVVAFETAYGDGLFIGSNGFSYAVDSGTIGLVPYLLGEGTAFRNLVTIIEFERDVIASTFGSILTFGDIVIDTDDFQEEEELCIPSNNLMDN